MFCTLSEDDFDGGLFFCPFLAWNRTLLPLLGLIGLLFVGLSVVADVLSDYMDGWKMLGCYYMQLGFPKTSEADCWTLCLLHWSVVGYLVVVEGSHGITSGCVGCMFVEVGCCGLLKLASLSSLCVATICILDVFWHLGAVFVSPLCLLGLKKLATICGSPIPMRIVVGCF
ncbi:hypothetical protein Peur_013551 [Populus x canadensis]